MYTSHTAIISKCPKYFCNNLKILHQKLKVINLNGVLYFEGLWELFLSTF